MRAACFMPVLVVMSCTLGLSQNSVVSDDLPTLEAVGYQAGFRDGLRQADGLPASSNQSGGHRHAISKDPEFQLGYNVGFAAAQNQVASEKRSSAVKVSRQQANSRVPVATENPAMAALDRDQSGSLLLPLRDGRRIVQAVNVHRPANARSDCSHVVNDIYRSVALDYPYASSRELYSGVERFQRVQEPHPGDVIVWPGHAGIVLDPSRHTFYSALSSGPGIDSYSAPYWRTRGRARFYRYSFRSRTEYVSLQTLPTSRASATTTAPHEYGETSQVGDGSNVEDSLEGQAHAVAIETSGKKPSSSEVIAAILRFFRRDAERAHKQKSESFGVFVFDQIKVSHVKVKQDTGFVRVKISSTRSSRKESSEGQWELRLRHARWEIIIPPAITYQAKNAAV